MRKLLIALPIIGVLGIIGCEREGPVSAPEVTKFEATEKGAGLLLEWKALSGVDGYKIYVDGIEKWKGEKEDLSVVIYGPAKEIELCGYTGDKEGPRWSSGTELVPVVTTLTVYGASDPDPDHPSGFGFATDGTCIAYPLGGPDTTKNWPKIDFYIEDRGGIPISLFAPTDVPTNAFPYHKLNDEENASVEVKGITDFDEIDSAYAPGDYETQTQLKERAVYSIWIDPNANGWDNSQDHFGKLKVVSITGKKVDIKVAYQKKPGYRMVVTP